MLKYSDISKEKTSKTNQSNRAQAGLSIGFLFVRVTKQTNKK